MARDLNKVMLIGRLTRDPELRTTPNGKNVASFGLATGRTWRDQQGNQQEATEFHNIVAWERQAELVQQYLSKGRQIYVEGRLQTRNWEGKEDGVKRYRTEVIAENIIFLGSPGDASSQAPAVQQQPTQEANQRDNEQQPTSSPQKQEQEEEIRIEDIPF